MNLRSMSIARGLPSWRARPRHTAGWLTFLARSTSPHGRLAHLPGALDLATRQALDEVDASERRTGRRQQDRRVHRQVLNVQRPQLQTRHTRSKRRTLGASYARRITRSARHTLGASHARRVTRSVSHTLGESHARRVTRSARHTLGESHARRFRWTKWRVRF